MMEYGALEEGVRRLLNFMRKSGCVLHIRCTNPSLSGPSREFHVSVTHRARDTVTRIQAAEEFLRAIGLWIPALNTRVGLCILDSASE